MGHSRKHPYHPHGGNRKLTPLPPSDVLIHLLLSETIVSPLPLRTAEISSVGGIWIFSGTTQCNKLPLTAVHAGVVTTPLARNHLSLLFNDRIDGLQLAAILVDIAKHVHNSTRI